MTGPEHYTAAERVFEDAKAAQPGSDQERFLLAAAQLHATLALAAATAMGTPAGTSEDWEAMPPADARAWVNVAGVKPAASSGETR